jgi:hypothetical protein
MIRVRPSQDRGHAQYGWLDSRHSFSFGDYYDPAQMGIGPLRVINDDRVSPGEGFPTHPHRDMEIISYVVEGALEHKDSMGNGSVIRPGEVQRMRAGTGVTHSEYNASASESVRFLQIWVIPSKRGLEPSYEQTFFGDERRGRLRLVASSDGADGSVQVEQDLSMFASVLEEGQRVEHALDVGRRAWLQVVRGALRIEGVSLEQGDGALLTDASSLAIDSLDETELLLFDIASMEHGGMTP